MTGNGCGRDLMAGAGGPWRAWNRVWNRARNQAGTILLTVLFFLAGCVTVPYDPGLTKGVPRSFLQMPDGAASPVVRQEPDSIDTSAGTFGVTTVKLDGSARVTLATAWAPLPEEALIVMTTPWRQGDPGVTHRIWGRRIPVGIARAANEVLNPAEPPYWAIRFPGNAAGARIVPQMELVPPDKATPESVEEVVLGGFFPLVLNGDSVASRFPGGSIRAARVVFARHRDGGTAVITVEGSRLFSPGPTTDEHARWLVRNGYEWALNLDGGRSSAVVLPDGTLLPRGITFRRAGPVGIAVFVIP